VSNTARRGIGILGGMGPAATADFYGKLIQETPATQDQDHLHVVIWADPSVPDRSQNLISNGRDPTPWLRRGIRALTEAGCDVLAVPCNTAHAFVPELAREAGIELVSIVEVTADAIAAEGLGVIGLLATTGTLRSHLYTEALQRRGITVIEPTKENQSQVMAAIHAAKSGVAGEAHAQALIDVSTSLYAQGAERIVAACTELVLALDHHPAGTPVIDPARLLARRVVNVALNRH
jgi:aspartate racemase